MKSFISMPSTIPFSFEKLRRSCRVNPDGTSYMVSLHCRVLETELFDCLVFCCIVAAQHDNLFLCGQ